MHQANDETDIHFTVFSSFCSKESENNQKDEPITINVPHESNDAEEEPLLITIQDIKIEQP